MSAEQQLTIEIHCHALPGAAFGPWRDVELGIQRGADSVDTVPGDADGAVFTAVLRVARNAATGNANFLGPYAHGTPAERFLYLSWSGVGDGPRTMFRRSKIMLSHLTWDQVGRAIAEGRPLVATAMMTAKDGGPACGAARRNIEWAL